MTALISFFLQICHNKNGEINPKKIASLVEAYVKKVRVAKKRAGGGGGGFGSTSANIVKKPA